MEQQSKEQVLENYRQMEYNALKSEQLYRYEYNNKLRSDFIVFSTAVLTACIAGVVVLSEANNTNNNGYDFALSMRERFVIAMFLLPILYSKISFNHALENEVRLRLISDYLRESGPAGLKTWFRMKQENNIQYYFDGLSIFDQSSLLGAQSNKRRRDVGDIINLHRIMTGCLFILYLIFTITANLNCLGFEHNGKINCASVYIWGTNALLVLTTIVRFCWNYIRASYFDDCQCDDIAKMDKKLKDKLETSNRWGWRWFGISIIICIGLIIVGFVALNKGLLFADTNKYADGNAIQFHTLLGISGLTSLVYIIVLFYRPSYMAELKQALLLVVQNERKLKKYLKNVMLQKC